MTFLDILAGFKILEKYISPNDYIHAEHDQIWVAEYNLPLTEEEKAQMEKLGFFEDNDSWSAFT